MLVAPTPSDHPRSGVATSLGDEQIRVCRSPRPSKLAHFAATRSRGLEQGHRLPLELVRERPSRFRHSTPSRSLRSLPKVSTEIGEDPGPPHILLRDVRVGPDHRQTRTIRSRKPKAAGFSHARDLACPVNAGILCQGQATRSWASNSPGRKVTYSRLLRLRQDRSPRSTALPVVDPPGNMPRAGRRVRCSCRCSARMRSRS